MHYFLDTVETIPEGKGFVAFGTLHLCWLAVFVLITIVNCLLYRRMKCSRRAVWRKTVAVLLILDELFKMAMLTAGGRYNLTYLPLHLCSINIFFIAFHAWKPTEIMSSFLYSVCIPGALAALLFPSWATLPLGNFMHLHSFTIHILLAMYPIVLTVGGDIKVKIKQIPKCILFLLIMAIPIYLLNMLLDTNYMFLMYAEEGNPLFLFEQMWGSHLFGFPIIIAGVLFVMYIPVELVRFVRRKCS